MKKQLLTLALVALTACSGGPLMTSDEFASISLGTPIQKVEKKFGAPVSIHSAKDDKQVYEYIERVNMGLKTIEFRKYFLYVKNGKVVGKAARFNNPPPYDDVFDDNPFPDQQ